MKIAIYSPYLDTAGGGEKYILTIAEVLSKAHEVELLIGAHLYSKDIDSILEKIRVLHNLDLSKIKVVKSPIGKGSNFLGRINFLKKYDYLFYLTDGSFFYSSAKQNIIHFQVPFQNLPKSLWNNLKLKSWDLAIYNSKFTKNIIEKNLKIKGKVIYPPVAVEKFGPQDKKKQIISVGRFFGYLKDKQHSLLIDAFKNLVKSGEAKDWSLHLVGAAGEGDQEYLKELEDLVKGSQILLHPNLPFEKLIELYGQSQIYWHAMGYNQDNPEQMEHFGITVVEAMASGCVPVVIKKGGLLEIIEENKSGLFWEEPQQLEKLTLELIQNPANIKKIVKNATKRSKQFSKENFESEIISIINE